MPAIAVIRRNLRSAVESASRGKIVPISRHGKVVAGIAPIELIRMAEEMEDRGLIRMARRAEKLSRGKPSTFIRDARSLM